MQAVVARVAQPQRVREGQAAAAMVVVTLLEVTARLIQAVEAAVRAQIQELDIPGVQAALASSSFVMPTRLRRQLPQRDRQPLRLQVVIACINGQLQGQSHFRFLP